MRLIPIFFFLSWFFSLNPAIAQFKGITVSKEDSVLHLRQGPSTYYSIIDTIKVGKLVIYDTSRNQGWYKVIYSYENSPLGHEASGFLPFSNVVRITDLPGKEIQELIEQVLKQRRSLAIALDSLYVNFDMTKRKWVWESKDDSLVAKDTWRQYNNLTHSRYMIVLDIIPYYFCNTRDEETLKKFIQTVLDDLGSMFEMPGITLAECLICQEELVLGYISQIKNNKDLEDIINILNWGLINILSIDPNQEITDSVYLNLKESLEALKK